MTIHGAKGREFPIVFIPSLNKDRVHSRYRPPKIPIPRALWDVIPSEFSEEEVHYQEERRLLYVGITRGKERVFLSDCLRFGTNKRVTPPSMFLSEILEGPGHHRTEDALEVVDEPEERAETVEELLMDVVIGDVANGDYQHAVEAIAALAKVEGTGSEPLVVPVNVDLEGYLTRLRERYDEPDALHAATAHFSPSRLRSYEECPAKYRFNYVLGIPQMDRTYFELGTVVHGLIEKITKRMVDGDDVGEEEALELLEDAWRSSVWDSEEMERQDRESAQKMVRDFLVRQRGKDARIVGIEQWIDLELEGRRVSGKIDRVDDHGDHLEVTDYKTSRRKESRPKLRADFQMVLYWEGAESAFEKPVRKVGHWYLRLDEEMMVEISPEEREAVLDRARGIIRSVEAMEFPATPDYNTCRFCDYADLCDDRHQ